MRRHSLTPFFLWWGVCPSRSLYTVVLGKYPSSIPVQCSRQLWPDNGRLRISPLRMAFYAKWASIFNPFTLKRIVSFPEPVCCNVGEISPFSTSIVPRVTLVKWCHTPALSPDHAFPAQPLPLPLWEPEVYKRETAAVRGRIRRLSPIEVAWIPMHRLGPIA